MRPVDNYQIVTADWLVNCFSGFQQAGSLICVPYTHADVDINICYVNGAYQWITLGGNAPVDLTFHDLSTRILTKIPRLLMLTQGMVIVQAKVRLIINNNLPDLHIVANDLIIVDGEYVARYVDTLNVLHNAGFNTPNIYCVDIKKPVTEFIQLIQQLATENTNYRPDEITYSSGLLLIPNDYKEKPPELRVANTVYNPIVRIIWENFTLPNKE
jgi:hypothetical protein